QHAWAADGLRNITIRPLRQRTRDRYVIVGDPLMAVIDGDFVAGIEVVDDFEIDLLVGRKENGSISGIQISCRMALALLLLDGWGATGGRHLVEVAVLPIFPISEHSIPRAVCQHSRTHLGAVALELLIP